mmetsp:Transcript_43391/g.117627  ORF Transcript_43391/g.117627 Transcript_43391/m.117627 type:complete len:234 (+) Transcript_43391:3975-4676(+)
MDHRLAILVAVVTRTIRGVDADLEWRREVARVGLVLRLPRQVVARDEEVTDTVRAHARNTVRALPGRLHVTQTSTGTSLSAVEGRHRAREVVGLRREDRVKGDRLVDLESTGAARGTRLEVRDLVTLNSTRVVVESDHRVLLNALEGRFDHLEESRVHLLTIDNHTAAKEPMARVLTVRLGHVVDLNVRRVTSELLLEEVGVEVKVPVIETKGHLTVNLLKRRTTVRLGEEPH